MWRHGTSGRGTPGRCKKRKEVRTADLGSLQREYTRVERRGGEAGTKCKVLLVYQGRRVRFNVSRRHKNG